MGGLYFNIDRNVIEGLMPGCFYAYSSGYNRWASMSSVQSEVDKPRGIRIDVNSGNKTDNPMAGHATGPDIHPYSIYLVPLITY